jgi:hypothetical protein
VSDDLVDRLRRGARIAFIAARNKLLRDSNFVARCQRRDRNFVARCQRR